MIGINSENIFGVSPESVGMRDANGWSIAATTQYSKFTTRKLFLEAAIRITFDVGVVMQTNFELQAELVIIPVAEKDNGYCFLAFPAAYPFSLSDVSALPQAASAKVNSGNGPNLWKRLRSWLRLCSNVGGPNCGVNMPNGNRPRGNLWADGKRDLATVRWCAKTGSESSIVD